MTALTVERPAAPSVVETLREHCPGCTCSHGTVVRTGPLVVDREAREAFLDDERLRLTGVEYALLDVLASRVGRLCSPSLLSATIWGFEVTSKRRAATASDPLGFLRTPLSRLRAKLGTHRDLIVTEDGRGLRLRQETPHPARLPVVEVAG